MSHASRFTKEEALNWKVQKQYDGRSAPHKSGGFVYFKDFGGLLASYRRAQELSGQPLLTSALSDAICAACHPGEEMAHARRGTLQYVVLLQTRHPVTEADPRWGTTTLADELLDASGIAATISDEVLQDLIARFGTARPKGARSLYARQ